MAALDAVGEVSHLKGAVVDGKVPGDFGEVEIGSVGGRMLEADDALEAEFRGAAVEARDRHMIAEGVLGEAQAARFRTDVETRLDDFLIVRIARTKHHAVLAESDRLPVSIGRDVPDGQ